MSARPVSSVPARLAAVPPAAWLALAAVVAFGVTTEWALGLSNYFSMADELGYMKQSVEIGRHLWPSLPGDPWFSSYAQLGPLMVAPAYALFSAATAFDVAHVINAALMASTAVPTYLLARSLVPPAGAALAGALSVSVPWLVMAGTILTEPAAYPAFTWAVLAMRRTIEDASPRNDVVVLAGLVLAFLARTQFVVLAGALVGAIVLHELGYARRRWPELRPASALGSGLARALHGHRVLFAVIAVIVLAIGVGVIDRSALGAYADVTQRELLPPDVGRWIRELLVFVAVGVGVAPLVLSGAWAGLTLARPRGERAHAFAALSVVLVAVMALVAGSFAANFGALSDRYLFYLAPLLFCGMVALLFERRQAVTALVLAALGTALLLVNSDQLALAVPSMSSPTTTFHAVLNDRSRDLGILFGIEQLSSRATLAALTLIGALGLVLASRSLPQGRVAVMVGALVLSYCAVETRHVMRSLAVGQPQLGPTTNAARSWLDRALPGDSRAAPILAALEDPSQTAYPNPTTFGWWDLSFYNKRADRPYVLEGAPQWDQTFYRRFTIEASTGALEGLDHGDYLLRAQSDLRFALRGERSLLRANGFEVFSATKPYAAAWRLFTEAGQGAVRPGQGATLRLYPQGGADAVRHVTITLGTRPLIPQALTTVAGPFSFRVVGGQPVRSGTVPAGGKREVVTEVRVDAEQGATLRIEAPPRHQNDAGPSSGGYLVGVEVGPA